MKVSKKYHKIAEAYTYFSRHMNTVDLSDEAKTNMYSYETHGHPVIKYNELLDTGLYNGYAVGKHWMDVTIAMWKEDIQKGFLTKHELYEDQEIPEFVKKIVEKL